MARGALSSGDLFGWREPVLPPGRAGRLVEAVEAWRADDERIVLASDQAPRLADVLGEAGHPVAVVERVGEAPPPGAITLIERSLNGGFIGGPDGLAFVTDRELFGTVRIRRPKALRRVVPRDILERLSPGDLVVHIEHGVARYERMLGAAAPATIATTSSCRTRAATGSSSRSSRSTGSPATRAASARPSPSWAAPNGCAPSSACARRVDEMADELLELYASRERPGPRLRAGHALAARAGGVVPLRGDATTSCAAPTEVKADMERPRPMDRLVVRRRRLRQDRGRAACGVQGRHGRQAGGDPRADDGPGAAALQHLLASGLQPSRSSVEMLSRFRSAGEQGGDARGPARRHRRHRASARTACCRTTSGFKDLGLVIIDEEQRFGVAHKERLKQLAQRWTC